ncbi:MAG TPA: multifunctional 2',3'-cyclic-nucleotide 2'-phosphodiesterase/5'-nucleotidase/3'-nucleotidase, partial [Firmicutes bacterium]|nr:multifunctional 2',3'-cyclic-nucleotide 2'-phosphodiesterase/5'-nucleotidase/3'-nucleotidase [Bacillota bacterium]
MKKPQKILGIISAILLVFVLTACPAPQPKEEPENLFTLTVLHTNDTHARIMDFNKHGTTCNDDERGEDKCFGGVARRATEIKRIRAEEPNMLLVDAGDQFQGTLFYTQYKGKEAKTFMNMLGYDAMTSGNHEFDDGPEILSEFIKGINFPFVVSNIDVEDEPLLRGLIKPWAITDKGGRKIGIIGLTTEDTGTVAKPGPNVYFDEVEASAQRAVDALAEWGVNIIIALSHNGYNRDMEIAAAVTGIDILVGGHTHTFLSNTHPDAEGPYPTIVESPSGDSVLVVTAKSWGMYLGYLNVKFNDDGIAEEWSGEPILLDSSIAEDEEVLAEALKLNEQIEPLTKLVVGRTEVDLTGDENINRHFESNMGNLITDAMLWEAKHYGMEIAFYNGGGIRSGIQKGDITLANVLEVMPFSDTLATLELTGADIKDLIEYSVSRAEDPNNEGTGRFLHFSGLR